MSIKLPVLSETDSISSPGLWVDRAAITRNIEKMVACVDGPDRAARLRPHVKTHKMREVVQMLVAAGVTKCKTATPKETRMAAEGGSVDILIAHQLVGPKLGQVAELIKEFPHVRFSAIVDDLDALDAIAATLGNSQEPFPLRIDVDCGMHRTGIEFGAGLDALRDKIDSQPGVAFAGLHIYDGHLRAPDLETRQRDVLANVRTVQAYLAEHQVPAIVGGGSPTFGIWASETEWECSPGTSLFWDYGYGTDFPDLEFEIAAGLVTRVISKPGGNRICFDLGHKSVAAEMALDKRVVFPTIPSIKLLGQSEEHLVAEVPDPSVFKVGDAVTAIPRHICPTVALHARATVVDDGKPIGEQWIVAARDR